MDRGVAAPAGAEVVSVNDMSDNGLAAYAIDMWANMIETGDTAITAREAAERKMPFNALSLEQMKFVIRLRELSENIRKQDT